MLRIQTTFVVKKDEEKLQLFAASYFGFRFSQQKWLLQLPLSNGDPKL